MTTKPTKHKQTKQLADTVFVKRNLYRLKKKQVQLDSNPGLMQSHAYS